MRTLNFRHTLTACAGALLTSAALAACAGGGSTIPSGNAANTTPQSYTPAAIGQAATARTFQVAAKDRMAAATVKAHVGHMFFTSQKSRQTSSTGRKTESIVYPADLQYFGGTVLRNAQVFNAYVDSSAATFGNIEDFERNLSYSTMSHMLDEYVHTTAANRYDFAGNFGVSYPAVTNLGDNDLLLILHAVASGVAGGGYHHIYNIFLAPGINYCSTGTLLPAGDCNASPTSPNPTFCAFHDSVVFSDLGDTLFTVQPYQDTDYCGVDNLTSNPNQPTPNGLQKDTTYSALSHELFETITDPDPGTGWINPSPFYPSEIGDLCAYIPQNVTLVKTLYRIQLEYSNKQHGCNNTPP